MTCATLPRIAALCLSIALPATALAENAAPENGKLLIELNNAENTDANLCRLSIVSENATGKSLSRAAWQVAIFDKDGIVRALPLLDFGVLVAGKTKIAVFELPGRPCDDIARIVVNDVAECKLDNGEQDLDLCLTQLTTRTRTDIAFGI